MDISKLYSLFLEHPVVTTDTRDCLEGSIFFALKGASFNGNEFAQQALENGCSYAVIDEKSEGMEDSRLILVDDVLTTLQQLANYHRKQLGTKIIGVTGTNGKTTTKELIAAVLSEKYNVLYTLGNFNNHIGVPKTLLRLTKEHDIAVIEMGANHLGEIKTLVDIVEPDCGIITNVGRGHLGGFGSFEGVIKTKGELYDFLRPSHATVFIHNENEHLRKIANGLTLVKYGTEKADDLAVYGEVVECAPYLTFRWGKGTATVNTVKSKMIGDYNIYNMLAAATIGLTFGITEEQICHALTEYTPSNNRSQLTVTEHNRLVVDAYNANPTSMAAALNNFQKMAVEHKMVILGSMGELGDVSFEEHCKIVEMLKQMELDDVWLVGDEFRKTGHPFLQFDNVEAVKARIADCQPQGKYILIKGSNSQKLFQLPELL
ncbi:MAG: UDP-N-acetylmuramoyl-tripeptide--D-alanyl-D-alanine ligase [Prevotella sp.]|nr:UDP-N-acetylmuramoyl-tripeptide--D-alanyl-D-alanine ligase [Prevotella sp.]